MKNLIVVVAFGAALCAQPPQYLIEDLGPGSPKGINSSGQVAGRANLTGNTRAIRWTGTTPLDIGTLGTDLASDGHGINAAGHMAGSSHTPSLAYQGRPFRWLGTAPEELGPYGTDIYCEPRGINSSAQVSGHCRGTHQPIRWTGTTPEVLGLLGTQVVHRSYTNETGGINASGQVAGTLTFGLAGSTILHTTFPLLRAVRWTGTTPEALPTIGGPDGKGFAINDLGQVAGQSNPPTSELNANLRPWRAVIWTGTTATDLGVFPGGLRSAAVGINNAGWAVGHSATNGNSDSRAFVWTGTAMYNLNNYLSNGAGWVLTSASAINDAGQIAGSGTLNGVQRAYRLTPLTNVNVTFATSPTGLLVNHGTGNVVAPATITVAPQTGITITTPSPQAGPSTGIQYAFANWSDGGAQTHTITTPTTPATYTANFTTQYQLMTAANPSNGGTVLPPPSFYDAGALAVSAIPTGCFGFANWTGPAVSGGFINLTAPSTLTANFVQNQSVVASIGSLLTLRNPVRYRRTVAVANTLSYATSVSIILDGIGAGTTLVAPTTPSGQTTSCVAPAGRNHYTFANVPPGGTVSQAFDFTAPSASMVSLTVSAVVGPAPR